MNNMGDSGMWGNIKDMNAMAAYGKQKLQEFKRKPAFTQAGNMKTKQMLTGKGVNPAMSLRQMIARRMK